MKRILSMFLILFMVVSLFVVTNRAAAEEKGKIKTQQRLAKVTQSSTNRTLVNIGQIAMWIYSNGKSAVDPNNQSGLYYPRGSTPSTAAIYEDGFVWGGRVNDGIEPVVRVGGQAYSQGTVPGAILSKGVAENQNDFNVDRVWRIRRDFADAKDSDLQQDAAEFFQVDAANITDAQIQQLRDIYRQDWIDWPVYKGAPFYDADGDGEYNPQFASDGSPILYPDADEPGFANGDQVAWIVVNDLSSAATKGFYGSPPIGVEMQLTLWAYRRSDALGNIIFKQMRLIYKGTSSTPGNATIDSMYFCQWSDPDLGESGDDFAGCDTTKSLGFAYNATSQDNIYQQAGYPPPASGYDFFAGPIVPSVGDTAIFGLKKRADYRNLPMTTFGFFAAGQTDTDPTRGGPYEGTLQWFNLLRGYRPRPESPPERWPNGDGTVTRFRVPGDPVAGTGYLDSSPGDRRILLASGPITMALGDTNETVVSVIAGLGSDRLSSVSVLKFYDKFAQEAFDLLFELPSAPPPPPLTATEMDGEILLNWGFPQESVNAVENFNDKGFVFEGYNVYQLPNAGATAAQGKLLATYDVINEVTTIAQETFDSQSGLVLTLPVQQGKNTGLQRTLTVDYDQFRERPLANGRTYYFGVSSYSFNPDPNATLKTLESPMAVVTVVPQTLKPGNRLHAAIGDTISTVDHVSGTSDGSVTVIVTDPARLNGDSYKVVFGVDTTGGENTSVWHLINTTSGDTLLKNQTNQSGDEDYLNVDGFTAIIKGPPKDFKDFQVTANASGTLAEPVGAAADYYGFPGLGRTGIENQQVGGGLWFIQQNDPSDGTYDYFKVRVTQYSGGYGEPDMGFPFLIPNDYEIRFTAQGSRALFRWPHTDNPTMGDVPFELWNIKDAANPDDDFRLFCWINDADSNGVFNILNQDHGVSSGNNDPFTDSIYWIEPLDQTPGQAGYDALVAAHEADPVEASNQVLWAYRTGAPWNCVAGMMRMVFVNWNGGDVDTGVYNQDMPEEGTIFRIITTKPNSPTDEFTFSTEGFQPTTSTTMAKNDVEKINVFPNPYYGYNNVERDRFNRFVTFNHLPQKATIRIFTLSGTLVRTVQKDDNTQFATWDLLNADRLPVASGLYIIYIDMPDLGKQKILKLAYVREQEFLPTF